MLAESTPVILIRFAIFYYFFHLILFNHGVQFALFNEVRIIKLGLRIINKY